MDYSTSAFFQSLFHQIVDAATIITPNRRLAAHLKKIYAEDRKNKGFKVWQSPDILPLSSWFIRCWEHITEKNVKTTPYLLSTTQEKYLWEKILSQSSHHHLLLQVSETAELIQSAHGLLADWQVALDQDSLGSADYIALNHWLEDFKQICQEQNWLSQVDLPAQISQMIKQNPSHEIDILPKTIILYGFNELAPQIKIFFSECSQLGCQVLFQKPSLPNQAIHKIACETVEDEIYSAALYAKDKYTHNVDKQIGVVFLNLEKQRDRIKQIFSEVFQDENKFNISAGKSLNFYPIIHAALQNLSLYHGNFTADILGFLLSTPFLAHAEQERFQRAKFDEILRAKNISHFNFLTATDRGYWERYVPKLTQKLLNFFAALEKLPTKQSFTSWGRNFHALLMTMGWPGERSLSSEEFQTVENWLALFSELNSLDYIEEHLSYGQALHALIKITKSRKFQPQSPDANVQILGVLEAAAMPFDYLWITGMTDVSWPPSPNPHPYIPKSLQRKLNMPHATAQREFNYCRDITDQFQQCASEMICSYHQYDDIECTPSPLIINFPEIFKDQLSLSIYQTSTELIFANRALEKILDNQGPPINDNELIHGGVSVLKYQALCAFKAFAEWRLHAHQLEETFHGLRAKDRGALVHRALQLIWDKVANHENLIAIEEEMLTDIITACIEQTFTEKLLHYQFRPQYITLEKHRLLKLIKNWLNIEKMRAPFRVIQSEQKTEININRLKLSMRIDRIDELESGKHLIIDYKTGRSNEIRHWFSDRPADPQLPLYALIAPEKLVGISYAQVTPGDFSFKGVSGDEISIKGIKHLQTVKYTETESWSEQIKAWQCVITSLANNFSCGDASVNPKDKQTCTYCQLKPFCRIFEDENYVS